MQQSLPLLNSILSLNSPFPFVPSYALSKNFIPFSSFAFLLCDSSTALRFHASPTFSLFSEAISFLLPMILLLMRLFLCLPSSFSLIQIVLWLFFFNPKVTYFIADFFLIFPIDFPSFFLSQTMLHSFPIELNVWSAQYLIAYLFPNSFVRLVLKVNSCSFHTPNLTSYEGETVWFIIWNMKLAAVHENRVVSITFCIPYP